LIPGTLSLIVSDTVFALVVVSKVAVAVGDALDDVVLPAHPPKVKAPIINRTTKNCGNLNRIVSDCINQNILICSCPFLKFGF
jgi:hypothetical protein